MSVINKLKTVKKKWIYLAIGLIAVLIIGCAAKGMIHERFERVGEGYYNIQANQVYYDLLQIENTDNLKLTGDQAKAILPLIDQLNKTTDKKGKEDIINKVYSNLTPQQYYSLLQGNKSPDSIKGAKSGHGEKNRRIKFEGKRGMANVNGGALEAVVQKMLKDISAQ